MPEGAHVLRPHPQGTIVAVTVVPNASRSEVVGLHGATLRVRVKAPAERGMANKAVTKLLGQVFDCRADLLSGATSRRKRVLLRQIDESAAQAKIASVLA